MAGKPRGHVVVAPPRCVSVCRKSVGHASGVSDDSVWEMEYSVHLPPKSLAAELCLVAPDVASALQRERRTPGPGRALFVVVVFQPAVRDLCELCEAAAQEKDMLLERVCHVHCLASFHSDSLAVPALGEHHP